MSNRFGIALLAGSPIQFLVNRRGLAVRCFMASVKKRYNLIETYNVGIIGHG
jgi:hypothetical protein